MMSEKMIEAAKAEKKRRENEYIIKGLVPPPMDVFPIFEEFPQIGKPLKTVGFYVKPRF